MPGNPLGYSFAPTFENASSSRTGGSGSASSPQGALQTLNFRLPKVTGSSFSPLTGDTPQGTPFGGAVLQSVLRTLLGSEAMAGLSGMGPAGGRDNGQAFLAGAACQGGGSAPAPVVRPGVDGSPTGPVEPTAPVIGPGSDGSAPGGNGGVTGGMPGTTGGGYGSMPDFNANPYGAWMGQERQLPGSPAGGVPQAPNFSKYLQDSRMAY